MVLSKIIKDRIIGIKRRTVVVFLADTHAGSEYALCPPGITLYKFNMEGEPKPWSPELTPAQYTLQRKYEKDMAEVIEFAAGDELIVVHVGDLCQGTHFPEELLTYSAANQVIIAAANMQPWLELPNVRRMRFVSGTEVHEFRESSATVLVTKLLREQFPDRDITWVHHGLANIDGVTIDFAHHGPSTGKRKWMEMNNCLWYLKDIMTKELFDNRTPPRLVVRADKHVFGMGGWKYALASGVVSSDILVIPSYQAMNQFARKVTQSEYKVYHGLVAVEIIDGELGRIKPVIKQYDLRTKEDW